MPQKEGYTYEELVRMGAKPGGYTYDEAVEAGAQADNPNQAILDRQAAQKTIEDLGREIKAEYPYNDLSERTVGLMAKEAFPERYEDYIDPPPDLVQQVLDRQKAQFPTSEEQGGPVGAMVEPRIDMTDPNRTGGQVALDQMSRVGPGALSAVTGIPSTIMGGAEAIGQAVTGGGTGKGQEMIRGMAQSFGRTAKTLVTAPSPESPEWAEAAETAGANLGATLLPSAIRGTRAVAAKVPVPVRAKTLYQKALQPSPRTFSAKEIDAMVQTGMDNGIMVSRKGLNKLDALVNKLNDSIEADIATNPRAPLMPSSIASRLKSARDKARVQVNPESDLGAITASEKEFLRQHQTQGKRPADIPIAASQGQAIKKGTYQQINSKQYGELGTGSIEAQKQLARGIKEELEIHFPEIKAKNAAEGKLFDLRPELEAAVNRVGNRRMSLANILNVLADPAVTSRIAIILNSVGVPPATVASRMSQYALGVAAMSNAGEKKRETLNRPAAVPGAIRNTPQQ